MDERLLSLANQHQLNDGGFGDTPLLTNWATSWKVKTLIDILPLLYEPTRSRKNSRSSYGLKHEVEDLLRTYAPELSSLHSNWVGNGELILANLYLGYLYSSKSGPNAYYYLRDKRSGKNNKGGARKREAEEAEERVKQYLRQKVEENNNPSL